MAVQPSCAATACRNAANKAWNYAKANYWELPASILEAATLVLVVFFQDIGFKVQRCEFNRKQFTTHLWLRLAADSKFARVSDTGDHCHQRGDDDC